MRKHMKNICEQLPCREKIALQLNKLIDYSHEALPNVLYIYGHRGTGKTRLITTYFKKSKFSYVYVNCIECYTSKILYETIINKFSDHNICSENNFTSYSKCENLYDFIIELRRLLNTAEKRAYIICLDNAEKIRDMEHNILPSFSRLQEFSGLNICTILISQITFEKYYQTTHLPEIPKIYFPQYTKAEIQKILLKDFNSVKEHVKSKVLLKFSSNQETKNSNRMLKVMSTLQTDFYGNYLNIFLNVFYRVCRFLTELRMISRESFEIYCEPVMNGTIGCNDISKLWRHISKGLRIGLSGVYHVGGLQEFECNQSVEILAQSLELPYYAKYLLIASFLASYNTPKEDKNLFVKHHGKQKKRLQTINANTKVTEKMSTILGPKSFTIDRLLAIFYAILNEKVGLTSYILSQISSLVHLKLITVVANESNVEGSTRLQCVVSLQFISYIGKNVGFNVRQYICDFK